MHAHPALSIGFRAKKTRKIAARPGMNAPISRALPWAILIATYRTALRPRRPVMEYVNGMTTTVRKTGIAVARWPSPHGRRQFVVVGADDETSAAAATSPGTIAVSGVKERAAKNRPVTTEDSRCRAPSPTRSPIDEDRLGPTLRDPADRSARAVDRQHLQQPGIRPCASASPASVPTPMMVAIAFEEPGEDEREHDHADRHHSDVAPAAELDLAEE